MTCNYTYSYSATSTATSGSIQVGGACDGLLWDTAGPSAQAAAIPRSDNDSFGLTNISFGSSLVQAVESLSGLLLSSLTSGDGDGHLNFNPYISEGDGAC